MPRPSDIEEEIARILHENFNAARGRNGVSPLKLAQSLSPLLNRVRAEALREAALRHEVKFGEEFAETILSTPASRWLRAEAERIEQNSEGKS